MKLARYQELYYLHRVRKEEIVRVSVEDIVRVSDCVCVRERAKEYV